MSSTNGWKKVALRVLLVALWAGTAAAAGGQVDTIPPAPSPGEIFLVRLAEATVQGRPEVSFCGNRFLLWPAGDGSWEGLVGIDRDEKAGTKQLRILDRSPAGEGLLVAAEVAVVPRDYPVQRLSVSESMVTLSEEDQARAAREAQVIGSALHTRSGDRLWGEVFALPLEGPFSSAFGVRRFYNGKPKGYHSGLDIAVPRGTLVGAAAAGRVALVGDFFYTGKTVFVDHGLGLLTAYFHLDSVTVAAGEQLDRGSPLGTVGSTGRSTGPHLHWGVYLGGVKVDPLSLLRLVGVGAGGGESP